MKVISSDTGDWRVHSISDTGDKIMTLTVTLLLGEWHRHSQNDSKNNGDDGDRRLTSMQWQKNYIGSDTSKTFIMTPVTAEVMTPMTEDITWEWHRWHKIWWQTLTLMTWIAMNDIGNGRVFIEIVTLVTEAKYHHENCATHLIGNHMCANCITNYYYIIN